MPQDVSVTHDSSRTSLSSPRVVEEFFGEPIGGDLYARIQGSPVEHLVDLAEHLLAAPPSLAPVRFGAPEEGVRPAHLFDELYLHDQRSVDAFTSPRLKSAILYSERLVMPDPCRDWAESLAARSNILGIVSSDAPTEGAALVSALRRLRPILPLLDRGAVVLIASPAHLRMDPDDAGTLDDFAHDRGAGHGRYRLAHREDPVLAWNLVNRFSPVDDWVYRQTWGLDPRTEFFEAAHNVANEAAYDPEMRMAPDAVLDAVFGTATGQEVTDALSMQRLTEGLPVVPFTNSDVVRGHLIESSRVLFGEEPRPRGVERRGVEAAVHYDLPSAGNVTFDDVVRLRLNDDLHEELRRGLGDLAEAVASEGRDSSYADFAAGFAELSAHHLQARFEKLDAAATAMRRKGTIAGWAASGFVSFTANALLVSVGADPLTEGIARAGGNLVANAAKSGVERETSRRTRDIDTVRTLIGGLWD